MEEMEKPIKSLDIYLPWWRKHTHNRWKSRLTLHFLQNPQNMEKALKYQLFGKTMKSYNKEMENAIENKENKDWKEGKQWLTLVN